MTEHLIKRPAHLIRCPACSRHILAGITSGVTVTANTESLTIPGEITARLQGRMIFDIIVTEFPRRMYLEYRNLPRVQAGRKPGITVVAEHECRAPVALGGLQLDFAARPPGKAPARTPVKVTGKLPGGCTDDPPF